MKERLIYWYEIIVGMLYYCFKHVKDGEPLVPFGKFYTLAKFSTTRVTLAVEGAYNDMQAMMLVVNEVYSEVTPSDTVTIYDWFVLYRKNTPVNDATLNVLASVFTQSSLDAMERHYYSVHPKGLKAVMPMARLFAELYIKRHESQTPLPIAVE